MYFVVHSCIFILFVRCTKDVRQNYSSIVYVCLIYWNILFKISHFNRKSRINNKRNDVIIHQNPFKVTTHPSKIVKSHDFTQNFQTLIHLVTCPKTETETLCRKWIIFSEYLKLYFMTFTILNQVMTSQSDHADLPQNVIFSLKLQLL